MTDKHLLYWIFELLDRMEVELSPDMFVDKSIPDWVPEAYAELHSAYWKLKAKQ